MGKAKFFVSAELIEQSLAMPDGAKILDISRARSTIVGGNEFLFVVESDELPERDGDDIPQITPQLTADYEKRPATWLTFEWNKE